MFACHWDRGLRSCFALEFLRGLVGELGNGFLCWVRIVAGERARCARDARDARDDYYTITLQGAPAGNGGAS